LRTRNVGLAANGWPWVVTFRAGAVTYGYSYKKISRKLHLFRCGIPTGITDLLNAPANDNLGSPEVIGSVPFTATVDITDATTEPNERQSCYFTPGTVLYAFTRVAGSRLRRDPFGHSTAGSARPSIATARSAGNRRVTSTPQPM
jgi:hypothetical protein